MPAALLGLLKMLITVEAGTWLELVIMVEVGTLALVLSSFNSFSPRLW